MNRFPGRGLLRGLTTLPMVLPPVVGGIALLLAYGRRGFIGDRPAAVALRGGPDRRQPAARNRPRHLLELDGGGKLSCAAPASGPALAVIAPAAVSVARHRPQRQEESTWPGQISAVDLMGDRVRVRVDGTPAITAEVQPATVDELKLDDGGEIWVSVHSSDIPVYPP